MRLHMVLDRAIEDNRLHLIGCLGVQRISCVTNCLDDMAVLPVLDKPSNFCGNENAIFFSAENDKRCSVVSSDINFSIYTSP